MHPYSIPEFIKDRVVRRQGKLFSHDTIEAARSALVVVDSKTTFCAEKSLNSAEKALPQWIN